MFAPPAWLSAMSSLPVRDVFHGRRKNLRDALSLKGGYIENMDTNHLYAVAMAFPAVLTWPRRCPSVRTALFRWPWVRPPLQSWGPQAAHWRLHSGPAAPSPAGTWHPRWCQCSQPPAGTCGRSSAVIRHHYHHQPEQHRNDLGFYGPKRFFFLKSPGTLGCVWVCVRKRGRERCRAESKGIF